MASADCSSADTVSPAGLPKAGQILLRISVHSQHTGCWAASMVPMFHLWEMPQWIHLALAKAGELLQQHFGEMTLAWVGGGREASLCWRPSVSHHSSSFLLHGLIAAELQILPKGCPLPILLCWLAGITLFLCSLSEQQQHLSPCSLSKSA